MNKDINDVIPRYVDLRAFLYYDLHEWTLDIFDWETSFVLMGLQIDFSGKEWKMLFWLYNST